MEIYRDGDLSYRIIGKDHTKEVINLIEDIYSRIPDKKTFIRDTEEEIEEMLSGHIYGIGVYKEDEMIAYRYMSFSSKEESLAKYVRNLDIPNELIVNMESVMVREDARGRGIQNQSRQLLIDYVLEKGLNIFMSTVSPDNEPSFRNVLTSGFTLVELADVYIDEENPLGWKRFIFYRNYTDELQFIDEEICLDPKDLEAINKALNNKFFGVNYKDGCIVFKKLKL